MGYYEEARKRKAREKRLWVILIVIEILVGIPIVIGAGWLGSLPW